MQLALFDTLAEEVKAMPSGLVLRDYQQAAVDHTFDLFARGSDGVIVRQPTGTGKTVAGTSIADQWLSQGPKYRVIILAHERQLIHQFADEVEDILGTRPGVEMASEHSLKADRIVVASRQTLYMKTVENEQGEEEEASRLFRFDPHRFHYLVILDEVHRWQWNMKSCKHILEWFSQNPKSRRLGLTATPERGDGRTLAKVVPDVASDYMLFDIDGGPCAVRDGWAVPYDQRFVTVEGVDFTNLREVAKDFDPSELEKVLGERETLIKMVRPMLDIVEGKRVIIFSATVNLAKWVGHTINGELKREAAESLDGDSPEHVRRDTYYRHQKGDFQFLSVCGLCREGYNDPGIGAVVVFRPTKSRGLAEQMKGRGCRPLRGCVTSTMSKEERLAAIAESDKPSCLIVDLVGVTGLADCATTAHILASGKPDEVIDRANENALKSDVPVDIVEEIHKAQAEIDEEKEAARVKRVEREEAEQREAERLAKIQATVHYSQQTVQQGHGASNANGRQYRGAMPFGKHRGNHIANLPGGYLRAIVEGDWCKTKWIKNAAANELRARDREQFAAPVDDVNRMFQEVG